MGPHFRSVVMMTSLVLIAQGGSGCAWVPSREGLGSKGQLVPGAQSLPSASQVPSEEKSLPQNQAAPLLDGSFAELSVSWASERKAVFSIEQIQRNPLGESSVPGVISLPVSPPDQVQIALSLRANSADLQDLGLSAEALTGENIETRALGVDQLEFGASSVGTRIVFSLKDVATVLSAVREQRIFVRLKLQSPKLPEKTLLFSLSTPPSKLTVLFDRFHFRGAGVHSSEFPQELTSQAKSRFLVRSMRVRNDTFLPVRLELPFRSELKMRAPAQKFWSERVADPNPFGTVYTQKSENRNQEWNVSAYLYESSEGLERKWTGLGQTDLNRVILEPGQARSFALYVDEGVIWTLDEHPAGVLQRVARSVGSKAVCPADRIYAPLPQAGWCENFRDAGGWKFSEEAVTSCRESIERMASCLRGAQEACNQAALVDLRLDRELRTPHPSSAVPWPIFLGCRRHELNAEGRLRYIHYGWGFQPLYAEFLEGLQSAPVTLEGEGSSLLGHVRFATGHESSDQEYREWKLWALPMVLREK